MFNFNELLSELVNSNSPDLHLHVGQYPVVRLDNGNIASVDNYPILKKEDLDDVINTITNEYQRGIFKEEMEYDFSFSLKNIGRFRVNIYQERFGPAIAFRTISEEIPSLKDLGLGPIIEKILQSNNGLVLVTGPTGSGKSTTLAAMIDYINQKRQAHIITIEDPIEYVYKSKNSLITQREVSVHTKSFSSAIRSALRQDPDVVLVGEMCDLETIQAAITLAETGHLVFSTLHTQDAPQTIDRIIDVFSSDKQAQIKTQLGNTLNAVISQILIPKSDGDGRIAAREIMLNNDGIRNCILKSQTKQIYSMIQIAAKDGMTLMNQSLENLAISGAISKDNAILHSSDMNAMALKLSNL